MRGSSVDGGVIGDIDLNRRDGALNCEGLEGRDGFRPFGRVSAAEKDMVVGRREKEVLGCLEPNALVGAWQGVESQLYFY